MIETQVWRRISVLVMVTMAVLSGTACNQHGGHHGDHHGGHGQHAPVPQPSSAGPKSGSATLGQSFQSLDELTKWVQTKTGQCADAQRSTPADFARFVGPERAKLYEPFLAEWATCSVPPDHAKVGLVLFKPDQLRAFQESWKQAMRNGQTSDNPDFSFGNGFAITSAELGVEQLGLRQLWCAPVPGLDADQFPADVDGCVFATTEHH